jgi:hypothetical protein
MSQIIKKNKKIKVNVGYDMNPHIFGYMRIGEKKKKKIDA